MKKGFTLVELIGVMVILAILMILVFPNIINTIKTTNDKLDNYKQDLIFNAVKIQMNNNPRIYTKTDENQYCFLIYELRNEEILSPSLDLSENNLEEKAVKVTYSGGEFSYEIVSDCYNIVSDSCFSSATSGYITDYDKTCGKDVVIPYNLKINNCATPSECSLITAIGDNAFNSKQISNVRIPSNITTIGDDAFSSNNIINVTIGTEFGGSNLTTVGEDVFDETVETIRIYKEKLSPDPFSLFGDKVIWN